MKPTVDHSRFSLLAGLDEDLIAAAALPSEDLPLTGAALPFASPADRRRARREARRQAWEATAFSRAVNSGWGVAIICAVVSLAVLLAIVQLGQNGGYGPAWILGEEAGGNPPVSTPTKNPAETQSDLLLPPVSEGNVSEALPSDVRITSDGVTVSLPGYMVSYTDVRPEGVEGEADPGEEASGAGILNRLEELAPTLPRLITAGGSFHLSMSEGMDLRWAYLFTEDLDTVELDFILDPSLPDLSGLPEGVYYVVLGIHYKSVVSAEEWKEGIDEYGFRLEINKSLDQTSPVRVTGGSLSRYLPGYLLERTYYDAEQQKYVTSTHPGADLEALIHMSNGYALADLSVPEGTLLSLFVSDFFEFKSLQVYDKDLAPLGKANPFKAPLEEGIYYLVITATDDGTGETRTMEFPLALRVYSHGEPAGTPSPEPPATRPCVGIHTSFGSLYYENRGDGFLLWSEKWYDGGWVSSDGEGVEGKLELILQKGLTDGAFYATECAGNPIRLELDRAGDTLRLVEIYDRELQLVDEGELYLLSNLPAGVYVVVLSVESRGEYIPEGDGYERSCILFPFVLELYAPYPEPVTEPVP